MLFKDLEKRIATACWFDSYSLLVRRVLPRGWSVRLAKLQNFLSYEMNFIGEKWLR